MSTLARAEGGDRVQAFAYGATDTPVTVSTSANSGAVSPAKGRIVRIVATVDMHFRQGTAPTATTSDALLHAGVDLFVHLGGGERLSFIRAASATADGLAYVTECT